MNAYDSVQGPLLYKCVLRCCAYCKITKEDTNNRKLQSNHENEIKFLITVDTIKIR